MYHELPAQCHCWHYLPLLLYTLFAALNSESESFVTADVSPRSCLNPVHRTLGVYSLSGEAHQVTRVALAKMILHAPLENHFSYAIQDNAFEFPICRLVAVVDNCMATNKVILLK